MKTLTVFTPTYNRAYCLNQVYESLIRQTYNDFIWLIIDDGSTDNTKEVVDFWMKEKKIDIIYHFQENQGMHGAHNTAYSLINTELNVCIDSDDFMPDDAVDNIIKFWCASNKDEKIAGIIGLDSYKDGRIVGNELPNNVLISTLEDLQHKYKIKGDKKLIYRTEIVKKYRSYPIFKNERFVPLGTLYLLIDKDYDLLCYNKVLCIVEYLEDGSSRNIFKQYKKNPKGFQYARIVNMQYSKYFKVQLRNAIHYVSHSLFIKDRKLFSKTPKPLITIMVFPMGILLYIYMKLKTKDFQ
ncbi:glycosyltransferase family 2 protein [Mariniflexile sp.]|uniref:glycosyltransferase family 2 protein n=1 Tax=Mariniflexile sp. TaxID=1979402 RepID=UPI00404842AC